MRGIEASSLLAQVKVEGGVDGREDRSDHDGPSTKDAKGDEGSQGPVDVQVHFLPKSSNVTHLSPQEKTTRKDGKWSNWESNPKYDPAEVM